MRGRDGGGGGGGEDRGIGPPPALTVSASHSSSPLRLSQSLLSLHLIAAPSPSPSPTPLPLSFLSVRGLRANRPAAAAEKAALDPRLHREAVRVSRTAPPTTPPPDPQTPPARRPPGPARPRQRPPRRSHSRTRRRRCDAGGVAARGSSGMDASLIGRKRPHRGWMRSALRTEWVRIRPGRWGCSCWMAWSSFVEN
jgi:hypothetical protein